MPYYRCPSCGVTSYSAAGYSTVRACPECAAPLSGVSSGMFPPLPALTRSLPARPGSVAEARRALVALGLPEETHLNLELLVSELVTNAIRHAGPAAHDPAGRDHSIELRVSLAGGQLHVSVRDAGPGFAPSEVVSVERRDGGLGLTIVNALSKMWGVERTSPGCTVWCTLEARAA